MCTAATYKTKDFYFGRTLDYEFSYGEQIAVTPRNYPFHFRHMGDVANHYAIIGMAHVAADYPLYYDAVNEKGVGMAGLNFVGNAYFPEVTEGKENVASFEFIPWVLGQCANMKEVRALLAKINITGTPFAENMPAASLHWIIADADEAVTVESMKDGLKIYDNPAGVMTNNPPLDQQMFLLNNYRGLSPRQPENHFSEKLPLECYSRGMGALGLPGDLSSASRFARVAFTKMNSVSGDSEEESVGQFFPYFRIRGAAERMLASDSTRLLPVLLYGGPEAPTVGATSTKTACPDVCAMWIAIACGSFVSIVYALPLRSCAALFAYGFIVIGEHTRL